MRGCRVLTRPSSISGRAGDLGHVGDLDAGLADGPRRAAGGDQLEATLGEPARQVDQPALVGDREQRPRPGWCRSWVEALQSCDDLVDMGQPGAVVEAAVEALRGESVAVTSGSASTRPRKDVRSSAARRALRCTMA